MPSKNVVKSFIENGYYHVYNRGVEKRAIFLDEQDCRLFIFYLKMYLSSIGDLEAMQQADKKINRFIPLNLSNEVKLLCFALMPNHIHMQVKQITTNGITKLLQRVTTAYVMYFNRKYNRVGGLFQGTYKGALIKTEEHQLHLSRYLHRNAFPLKTAINYKNYSSYPFYLGYKNASWIDTSEILSYFKRVQRLNLNDMLSYQSFVEDYAADTREILGDLILDDD